MPQHDLTFNQYSADVTRHAQYPNEGRNMVYPAMGIVGESGELADKIKKYWRNESAKTLEKFAGSFAAMQDHACLNAMSAKSMPDEFRMEVAKEIGDVLWYLNALAKEINFTLEEIAALNMQKLRDRAERNVIKSIGDNR